MGDVKYPGIPPFLPRERKPIYSRILDNHLHGVKDWVDVAVEGEVLFPFPIAPIGQAVLREWPLSKWDEWDDNPLVPHPYDRLGGNYDEVVCRPQRFAMRQIAVNRHWQDAKFRDHIEQRMRRQISDAIAEHFPIVMTTYPVAMYLG